MSVASVSIALRAWARVALAIVAVWAAACATGPDGERPAARFARTATLRHTAPGGRPPIPIYCPRQACHILAETLEVRRDGTWRRTFQRSITRLPNPGEDTSWLTIEGIYRLIPGEGYPLVQPESSPSTEYESGRLFWHRDSLVVYWPQQVPAAWVYW